MIKQENLPESLAVALKNQFPDMQIVCAGDLPENELPPDVLEAKKKIDELYENSLLYGKCVDCGKQMANYPKDNEDFPENWESEEGWSSFEQNDKIIGWQCPECDKKDN